MLSGGPTGLPADDFSSPSPAPVDTSMASTAQLRHKYRAAILAVCVAAITITGTIYGAGLKTRQEIKAV